MQARHTRTQAVGHPETLEAFAQAREGVTLGRRWASPGLRLGRGGTRGQLWLEPVAMSVQSCSARGKLSVCSGTD